MRKFDRIGSPGQSVARATGPDVGSEKPTSFREAVLNAIGATGYVACAEEILAQAFDQGINFDFIVTDQRQRGYTCEGLVVGLYGNNSDIPVIGINISRPKGPRRRALVMTWSKELRHTSGSEVRFRAKPFSASKSTLVTNRRDTARSCIHWQSYGRDTRVFGIDSATGALSLVS